MENVELNGLGHRIRVLRKAVGAQPGEVRLTTGRDAVNEVTKKLDGNTESVEQTTLDVEPGLRAPTIIKIDVEGAELDVLRGARATIIRHRPALLVEVNDVEGLGQVLEELGYKTWSYDPERRSLTPAVPRLHSNVLALADVDAARLRLGSLTLTSSGPPLDRVPLPHGLKAAVLNRLPLLRVLLLVRDFLRDSGWLASSRCSAPITRDGRPLPWYTYPAVDFLEERIKSDMAVFEYGAGNSTLWWASRVAHVSAVESDSQWVKILQPSLPRNTDLCFEPADAASYATAVTGRGRLFDIVVIDGMQRNSCALACLPALKNNGVVIWDNSDWSALWADGIAHLRTNGFHRIDFRGIGPLNWRPWTTSVFYRPSNNCLSI